MLDLGLTGRVALVAGAGHRPPRPGIGRSAAHVLARGGAQVACVDLDTARAEAVAEEIRANGGEAVAVTADLTQRDQVTDAVSAAVEAFGRVDIVVDIIGEARWGSVLHFSDDDWNWTFDTNLRQAFLLMQAAAKAMVDQGTGGAMAVVSSVDALFAATDHVAYGAAKAGLLSLVRSFGEELGQYDIRVNAVLPGAVGIDDTDEPVTFGGPLQPLRRPTADDIAHTLAFFVSDLAGAVTGQALAVDGGASIKSPWGMPVPGPKT